MAIAGRAPEVARWLWYAAIACVPLTSALCLPVGYSVRPPTVVLAAAALLVLALAGAMSWRRISGDSSVRALAVFVAWAVAVTMLGLLAPLEPLKGTGAMAAATKGVVSLAMGVAVYVAARVLVADRRIMVRCERVLTVAMGVSLALAVVQLLASFGSDWALSATSWVSQHVSLQHDQDGYLRSGRVWGLALEPSWLASGLGLILLPWTLSRAVTEGGRWPWYGTVIAILGIGLSTSRGGLLLLALVVSGIAVWLLAPSVGGPSWRTRLASLAVLLILVALAALLAFRGSLSGSGWNPTNQPGLQPDVGEQVVKARKMSSKNHVEPGILQQLKRLERAGMLCRTGLAISAWSTFAAHPMQGVGLGLSPWYLIEHFPASIADIRDGGEIRANLDRSSGPVPNPKMFPLRLLAECGLVGGAIYAWFLWTHRPTRVATRTRRLAPLAIVVACALAVDWLTLDSFALVGPWLALAWLALERDLPAEDPGGDRVVTP